MADFEVDLCQDLVEDGYYCHYYFRYRLHLLKTLLRLVHCYFRYILHLLNTLLRLVHCYFRCILHLLNTLLCLVHCHFRYILHLLNTLLRLVHCYAHLSNVIQERNTWNNSFCVCALACLFVC